MMQAEFIIGFAELEAAFSFHAKGKTSSVYFSRLRGYLDEDWRQAVTTIIEQEIHFPKLATCFKHLFVAVGERRMREAREREWQLGEEVDGVKEVLGKIPFPPDLKALLDRRLAGAITQAELEEWLELDRQSAPPECQECNATGLVQEARTWRNGTYQQTLRCRCRFGMRWEHVGFEVAVQ